MKVFKGILIFLLILFVILGGLFGAMVTSFKLPEYFFKNSKGSMFYFSSVMMAHFHAESSNELFLDYLKDKSNPIEGRLYMLDMFRITKYPKAFDYMVTVADTTNFIGVRASRILMDIATKENSSALIKVFFNGKDSINDFLLDAIERLKDLDTVPYFVFKISFTAFDGSVEITKLYRAIDRILKDGSKYNIHKTNLQKAMEWYYELYCWWFKNKGNFPDNLKVDLSKETKGWFQYRYDDFAREMHIKHYGWDPRKDEEKFFMTPCSVADLYKDDYDPYAWQINWFNKSLNAFTKQKRIVEIQNTEALLRKLKIWQAKYKDFVAEELKKRAEQK